MKMKSNRKITEKENKTFLNFGLIGLAISIIAFACIAILAFTAIDSFKIVAVVLILALILTAMPAIIIIINSRKSGSNLKPKI